MAYPEGTLSPVGARNAALLALREPRAARDLGSRLFTRWRPRGESTIRSCRPAFGKAGLVSDGSVAIAQRFAGLREAYGRGYTEMELTVGERRRSMNSRSKRPSTTATSKVVDLAFWRSSWERTKFSRTGLPSQA